MRTGMMHGLLGKVSQPEGWALLGSLRHRVGAAGGDRRGRLSLSPRLRRTISCRAPMVPKMASSRRAFMSSDFLNVRLLMRSKAFFPWEVKEQVPS